MSEIAIKARELHRAGALPEAQVQAMYRAKKITKAERDWILSEEG